MLHCVHPLRLHSVYEYARCRDSNKFQTHNVPIYRNVCVESRSSHLKQKKETSTNNNSPYIYIHIYIHAYIFRISTGPSSVAVVVDGSASIDPEGFRKSLGLADKFVAKLHETDNTTK